MAREFKEQSATKRAVKFEAEPFVPRRGLAGGHRMTLAGNFLPRENHLPPPEEKLFQVEEDVQVLCHCHWQEESATAATLIIVHGLEGSSNSQYVIGTANKAFAAGMNAVRMNMRNCGGTEELGPTLYHSGLSGDVAAICSTLIRERKLTRIALAGYSMGGNLVLKCAGEWADSAPPEVCAVCAVSPAIDLSASVDAIHRPQNFIYEAKFLWGLNRRFRRKRALFPHRYSRNGAGAQIRWCRSIREFDDVITAPHSGFRDAEDYYHRAASARVLEQIRVPTLVINSEDDPFIRVLPESRAKLEANPNICFIETAHGGHCAFLSPRHAQKRRAPGTPNATATDTICDDGRWAERQIVRFVQAAGC